MGATTSETLPVEVQLQEEIAGCEEVLYCLDLTTPVGRERFESVSRILKRLKQELHALQEA